jgi:EAL domain-containing protein (putative c-di-GMP-specific phosphodiesterase class I)
MTPKPLVVLAEDDEMTAVVLGRLLESGGYAVEIVGTGVEALSRVALGSLDVLLCDIGLPDLDGVQVLNIARGADSEIPIILVTGDPSLDSAVAAVAQGAVGYLIKPPARAELLAAVHRAVSLKRLAATRRESFRAPQSSPVNDPAVTIPLECALETLFIVHQPVVDPRARRIVGYEVLVRAPEACVSSPDELLSAAARLGRLEELGRRVRRRAAESFVRCSDDVKLFVNLHPAELLDEDLFDSTTTFSQLAPHIVLELTERASLDSITDLKPRIDRLRELGFSMAIDDIGAGYSGLTSFAHVEPNVVKFDMSLVRDIDQSGMKQRLVRSLLELCRDLEVMSIAEGVETKKERECLDDLCCPWMQGFFFARPERGFPAVYWN